jgi:hypothetical protein
MTEIKPATGLDYHAIGQAAYEAFAAAHPDIDDEFVPSWDAEEDPVRVAWVDAGWAAVKAYDGQLTAQADRKAEILLGEAQKTAEADADAIRAAAENPADAFAKAQAIEAAGQ